MSSWYTSESNEIWENVLTFRGKPEVGILFRMLAALNIFPRVDGLGRNSNASWTMECEASGDERQCHIYQC